MIEGLLIALEGIDAAGTTTHSALLDRALRAKGLPVRSTRQPSDGPVGMLLRQILTGRVVVPGMGGPRASSWTTMALLFAADRMDHMEATLVPNLRDGVTVICDRYYHSSVAYQSLTGGGGGEDQVAWIKEINRHARAPDLTLVLDVSVEESARRRSSRGLRELYDDQDLQTQLALFYKDIETQFPQEKIVHIDAERSIEEVAADILLQVEIARGERKA